MGFLLLIIHDTLMLIMLMLDHVIANANFRSVCILSIPVY